MIGAEARPTPCVLAVWNEVTPYRAHMMRRIAAEMPDVRLIHFFTHAVQDGSMPWQTDLPSGLDVRTDGANRVPFGRYFHRQWRGLLRTILGIVEQEQPNLVIVAGHGDLVRLMLLRHLRRRGVSVVHYSDANVFGIATRSIPRDAVRLAYLRWVMRMPDAYMTMGTCGRAYYSLVGTRGKPVFAHPYEPDYGAIAQRDHVKEDAFCRRFGIQRSRRRFCCSARLVERKRVDVLLTAFIRSASELPDWDLLIAGTGPLAAQLQEMVPESLRDRVTFAGFLQMEDVRTCYHVSDVLVHPSQFEAWALVINEAVACGLPVIATSVTGAAVELVRHRVNGMLVPPGDVAALSRAMLHVAEPGRAADMGRASLRVLSYWRAAADPVQGLREAIDYFTAADGRSRCTARTNSKVSRAHRCHE
jgi:glycosyltransferase involved in cell wall biosynthesis